MRIRYVGPFAQPTGYAVAMHDYCMALAAAGVDLEIIPSIECDTDDLHPRYASLVPFAKSIEDADREIQITLIHGPPHAGPELARGLVERGIPLPKRVFMTTWETNMFPAPEVFRGFDRIIVPCHHNRQVIGEALVRSHIGTRHQVRVVPHTFSPWWVEPHDTKPDTSIYTFYTVGAWNDRKNPLGVVKAFIHAFTSKDDVQLIIISNDGQPQELELLLKCSGIPQEDLPRVLLVTERMSDDDLRQLHRKADCYVSVARGEGWGLGAFEAALMGNRVIAPNYAGLADALGHADNWFKLDGVLTPAISNPTIVGNKIVLREPNLVNGKQAWFEPSLGTLSGAMESVYHTFQLRRQHHHSPQTKTSGRGMRIAFAPDKIAEQLIAALEL